MEPLVFGLKLEGGEPSGNIDAVPWAYALTKTLEDPNNAGKKLHVSIKERNSPKVVFEKEYECQPAK